MRKEDKDFFESTVFKDGLNSGMGESYNIFCCKQAILIAESLREKNRIVEFHSLNWDEKKELVPDLDDGHSGNTFGVSCRLAVHYLPMLREKKINDILN